MAEPEEPLLVDYSCDHIGKRLTLRPDVNGNPRFQHQCPRCGDSIGNFLSKDKAALVAPIMKLPRFDEELLEQFRTRRRQEAHEKRGRERADFKEWYHEYLRSDEWRAKARLVHTRAGGICEGCRQSKSTQVHHLTYRDVGAEFLWDLVAICDACHERVHEAGK